MLETRTARIGREDDAIVIVRIRDGAYQSLGDAQENLSAALAEAQSLRRPLLVDIRTAQPLDAEVRHYYSGQELVDGFSAPAMLVEASAFGRMMGNVYLRVARPGIPTRLFNDEGEARKWLAGHLP
jgi:hypothetical protein